MRTTKQTFLVMLILAFPSRLRAEDIFADAARELAERIIAIMGPLENVELTFRNLTSIGTREASEAWRAVENELRSRGMRFARESEVTAKIALTLSENPQNLIWIAVIESDKAHEPVMIARRRPPAALPRESALRLFIQTRLIMEQTEPILDLTFLDGGLLVLDAGRLSIYRREGDRWILMRRTVVPSLRLLPRDPRGRLVTDGSALQAYLPGMLCVGTARPELALACTKSESAWPVEPGAASLEPAKNFFVRGDLPPFFSVAGIQDNGTRMWFFAGLDGRTRIYDANLIQAGSITGWGSDIAGIDSGCGARRQILVSLPNDPSERGAVQAFEVLHRQAVPVSAPVELPGPITALWPLETSNAVLAVSRDLKTGRYAAYHLSIICGH